MNFVKLFNLFGVDAMQIPCILGNGAPTSATEGAVGCLYMDTDTGELYKCTSVDNGSYSWEGICSKAIGDIEAALDAIIAIQEELIGVEIITFYINEGEYTAVAGMTWGEWTDSKYNPGDFFYDDYMVDFNGANFWDPDGNIVTPDMVIIAGASYGY